MVFFVLLAAGGLYGASRAGGGRFELPTRGPRNAHLSKANDYRVMAAAAHREAELHRSMVERAGTAKVEGFPDELRVHCQRVAAAAAELSRVENELSDYHEQQARLADPVAIRAP